MNKQHARPVEMPGMVTQAGYAANPSPAIGAKTAPTLVELVKRVHGLASVAGDHVVALGGIADYVGGAIPTNGPEVTEVARDHGFYGQLPELADAIDRLGAALERAQIAAHRIQILMG